MRKTIVKATVVCLLFSCRREMLSSEKNESLTQARALVSMNPLAGTPAQYPVQMAVVNSLAGGNFGGYQDGQGDQVMFAAPGGVATDAAGNIYVADAGNNRIRKVTPDGVVTTLAGDGNYGWKDGAALVAEFRTPTGVAVDASGNIYVADQDNNRIRKIAADGSLVTTIAGSDTAGFADGPGNRAKFRAPSGLAVDAVGTIYVADFGNNRIRRISTAGVVTQWCGSTAGFKDDAGANAQFNGPMSVAVAPNGVVYVADFRNNRIRKITSGVVTTLAGSGDAAFADGTGAAAKFDLPASVATDAQGNVYVTDALNNRIRKVTAAGVVTTPAGQAFGSFKDGYESTVEFDDPWGIVVDAGGNIYISDRGNNRIRRMVNRPAVRTLPTASLFMPTCLAIDPSGNLYTAASDSSRVLKITPDGTIMALAGSGASGFADGTGAAASFANIAGLTADAAGNIYVADKFNMRIRKITPGGVVTTFAGNDSSKDVDGTVTTASFAFPQALTMDAAGNLYVGESEGGIRKITPAGVVSTLTSLPVVLSGADHRFKILPNPTAMAMTNFGLLITCGDQNVVYEVNPAGGGTTVFIDGSSRFSGFRPTGIAGDMNRAVYIADGNSNVVWNMVFLDTPFDPKNRLAGSFPGGLADAPDSLAEFSNPYNIVLNPSTGVLYVTDAGDGHIRMLSR